MHHPQSLKVTKVTRAAALSIHGRVPDEYKDDLNFDAQTGGSEVPG